MGFLDASGITDLVTKLKTKFQEKLVSGTNIKTVNNTSLLGSGNVSVQPALVSGTNIKTVNNNSILGSGDLSLATLPSVSSSDNDKILKVVSGAWAAATSSGGGGVSVTTTTVTIAASDWHIVTHECTKNVSGVTANNTVIVTYRPGYQEEYISSGVSCIRQDAGTLSFRCLKIPTSSITVNVMIINS